MTSSVTKVGLEPVSCHDPDEELVSVENALSAAEVSETVEECPPPLFSPTGIVQTLQPNAPLPLPSALIWHHEDVGPGDSA